MMDENGEAIAATALALAGLGLMFLYQRTIKKRRNRRWYVRRLNISRRKTGAFGDLIQEMRLFDPEKHFSYFRMSRGRFENLLELIGPKIIHANTHAAPIGSAERLSLTLRALASGDSFETLAFHYKVGHSTAVTIFNETTNALWAVLKDEFVKIPDRNRWLEIARDFESLWNFLNCLGAIDGKHVHIQSPSNAGSQYFNYKDTHSIVFMAVVDANYSFTFVDVGAYGRQPDSAVFGATAFGRSLLSDRNPLDLPDYAPLPNTTTYQHYVFVADDAFPKSRRLVKPFKGADLPFEQKVFNYRLSRARRVVENAFGILAARFCYGVVWMHRLLGVLMSVVPCVAPREFASPKLQCSGVPYSGDDSSPWSWDKRLCLSSSVFCLLST